MTVVFGGLTPHAPVLIPDVGRGDTRKLAQTVAAMKELARAVAAEEPDLVVIVTPHASYQQTFGVMGRELLMGDFARYRAPQIALEAAGDPAAAEAVLALARKMGVPTEWLDHAAPLALDHGVTVPLYYLQAAGYRGPILPVTVSLRDRMAHRRFGEAIAQAVGELGKRTVLLASGDLSHRLTPDAPEGFAPAGSTFDRRLLQLLERGHWDRIYTLDEHLREEACECGYRTLLVLLGALERSLPQANLLAYEGPFGVGYATVTVQVNESAEQDQVFNPAGYARQVADTFLQTDRLPGAPSHFPPDPRGVYVCLREHGKRRACVGEVHPSEPTLAAEIARQTLAALKHYAKRHAITIDSVNHLEFSVYLVDGLEPIAELAQLDPAVHGLLLDDGERQVVVLPGLEGLTRPEDQLKLALEKGGVPEGACYQLHRFTGVCYSEHARPSW